ncbi:CYTH domain-containing protein [Cyanobium sp. Morenito 9A2]|uniref:CYTH domain-containing protein n=1 Tax=Cyanobium sp. Morenito 9A2 TaxID=2823718 RepID=UPI0020CD8656|nr:CYTH domain-containing protein [Cyanobium sp. Morenito 9A2]MCP9849937.1 CYTH domain-containing protein [Cyanobium sp. Morenito 9A2]
MALEIERRFLVAGGEAWRPHVIGEQALRQGYLAAERDGFTVRVRCAAAEAGKGADGGNGRAWLTLKAPTGGLARHEFEYPIPSEEAATLLDLAPVTLSKRRYSLDLSGGDWVLDVFEGVNAPLVIAEVELERADQPVPLPPWCSWEITGLGELSNAALAHHPFERWEAEPRRWILQHLGGSEAAP